MLMQHNIRRNKKVLDYLQQQLKRIGFDLPLSFVFSQFIYQDLSVTDAKEVLKHNVDITEDVLDIEGVYIETLKFIGLLEVCENAAQIQALVNRRKDIKYGKPLTDFDKILKAIMTVPNPKEKDR